MYFQKSLYGSSVDCCLPGTSIACRKIIDQELHDLVERYIQVDVCKMKKHQPQRFPGSLPISLTRSEKEILLKGLHLHSEKVDGVRYRFFGLKLYVTEQEQEKEKQTILSLNHMKDNIQTHQEEKPKKQYNTKNKKLAEEKKVRFQQLLEKTAEEMHIDIPSGIPLASRVENVVTATIIEEHNVVKNPQKMGKIMQIQWLNALMDRSNNIYLLLKDTIGLPESVYPFLLDGELTFHKESHQPHFLIMNITMSNGFSWTDFAYQDRIVGYQKFCKLIHQDKSNLDTIYFLPKSQFPWYQFDQVIQRMKHGCYPCDGIIATPNFSKSIEFGTDWSCYKFKDIHTIDVQVQFVDNNDMNFSFYVEPTIKILQLGCLENGKLTHANELYLETEQLLSSFFPINQHNNKYTVPNVQEWNNKIFEVTWDPTSNMYCMRQERLDKTFPNNAAVIHLTKQNVKEKLSPMEIYDMWIQHQDQLLSELPFQDNLINEENMFKYDCLLHPPDYLNKIVQKSNWNIQTIPQSNLIREIYSMQLSWYQSTSDIFAQYQQTPLLYESELIDTNPNFSTNDYIEFLLQTEHIKPFSSLSLKKRQETKEKNDLLKKTKKEKVLIKKNKKEPMIVLEEEESNDEEEDKSYESSDNESDPEEEGDDQQDISITNESHPSDMESSRDSSVNESSNDEQEEEEDEREDEDDTQTVKNTFQNSVTRLSSNDEEEESDDDD